MPRAQGREHPGLAVSPSQGPLSHSQLYMMRNYSDIVSSNLRCLDCDSNLDHLEEMDTNKGEPGNAAHRAGVEMTAQPRRGKATVLATSAKLMNIN